MLHNVLNVFYLVYLEDILIYSNSKEEYKVYVKALIDRLIKVGL